MAAPAAPAVAGGEAGTLAWLLAPVSPRTFFEEYFEKRPLVIARRQPDYYAGLLRLGDIDRVLTTLDRRYPDVALKHAGRELTADDYTVDGSVLDVARVTQLFAEGATVALAYLDTVLPPLAGFCRGLEATFSCPFQANIYLTPPNAQGARTHYDTHDVFVLQVAGTKRWTLYGTPVELPLAGQEFDPELHAPGDATARFELQPGDLAYVPRGVAHDAQSNDDVSLHITAGILRTTWADLLLEYVAGACLADPVLRRSLPPGFAATGFERASLRPALEAMLERVRQSGGLEAALEHFIEDFYSSCPPPLEGQLEQAARREALTHESRVRPRAGALHCLEAEEGGVRLRCYGRSLHLPAGARAGLEFALRGPEFRVRDVPGLDAAGQLTLVRRLAGEGLLQVL